MDTKTPAEKSGGEQQVASATKANLSYPLDITQGCAPLPSACDILQPLSHSSPLPPSGYLAAILGDGRNKRTSQAYQHKHECIQPTSSFSSSPGNSAPVTLQVGCKPPSEGENSPTQSDDSSQATPPPTRRTSEVDDRESPSSSGHSKARSVQKRSQEVQFLHDVDEDGIRTWRRWVVEYS
ncbi:hypothetical protein BDV18DRAFT_159868 [Aspergillus unguis]